MWNMVFFLRNLLILALITLFFGCESKNRYDINSDKAIEDMNTRVKSLQSDLDILNGELKDVKKVLEDPDIDPEVRASIRKEVHQGERFAKEIDQWISFLKVRRKQRYKSLYDRKGQKNLREQAEREIKAYFTEKKLKPIKRPWLERYRTAIEL